MPSVIVMIGAATEPMPEVAVTAIAVRGGVVMGVVSVEIPVLC